MTPPEQRASARERFALSLARWIAGPERRDWLDALEAELHHLDRGRSDWVLGGLVAAVKDRAWRERGYALALIAAPLAAHVAIPFAAMLGGVLAATTGAGPAVPVPIIPLTPLPFAMALGAVRPRYPAVISGILGFAAYKAIPAIALPLLFGQYVYVRWEAQLLPVGQLPSSGLAVTLALWCAGAWLGARLARRRRKRLSPPSP